MPSCMGADPAGFTDGQVLLSVCSAGGKHHDWINLLDLHSELGQVMATGQPIPGPWYLNVMNCLRP